MTSLSATFFSLGLALWPALACTASAADVTGSVELGGPRSDLSGVVIWLEPLNAHVPAPPVHLRLIQKNKTFTPHILPLSVGSSVEFPNLDPIFHNAFSNFNGQVFDIGLYPPGKSRTVTFRRPGVVRIFCNIHPTMSAVIVVVDSPFYAMSDRSGHYAISAVPPGRYRENVFFERATPEALAALSQEIEIKDAPQAMPVIRIDQTRYLPAPHPNKHGQPYPPESDSPYTVHE